MDGRNNVTHSYKHRKDFFRRDLPQDASLLSCKRDGCMVRSCLGCGRIAVRSLLQYDCRFLLSPPFWKRASCHRFQGAFRCGMTNREYCRQRGISEKSFYYWQRKFRTQIVASAAPQLVQLEAVSVTEEVLQIQYRGAELRLPAGVDMDAVSALLRSIQSL